LEGYSSEVDGDDELVVLAGSILVMLRDIELSRPYAQASALAATPISSTSLQAVDATTPVNIVTAAAAATSLNTTPSTPAGMYKYFKTVT
jgi:hypothetical protein